VFISEIIFGDQLRFYTTQSVKHIGFTGHSTASSIQFTLSNVFVVVIIIHDHRKVKIHHAQTAAGAVSPVTRGVTCARLQVWTSWSNIH